MKNFIVYKLFLIVIIMLSQTTIAADGSGDQIESKIITGNIIGKVTRFENQSPLAGANVLVLNTTFGASTELDGNFKIHYVPAGEVTLVVSYMGYKSERANILVEKDKTTTTDFTLHAGILETGAIVVTGTTTPYLYEEAPVKTEVIPRKLIEQTQACNLAEAMSLQTGVRVENDCQNCNFTQVRILGFDGKYSQVLIDGDPVVSTLAGVYALEQFPDEMINQIEIVKGGGSALYGGGAMAGTINLRTKQPNLNRSRISYNTQSLDGSMDHRIGVMTELVSDDGRTGAYIFGSARQRDYYDYNNDGFSELGTLSNESIGMNWYYRPAANNELQASFHRIHEERRGGNDFDKPEHEADIAESLVHARWGGKLRWVQRINSDWDYQAYYSFSLLDRDSYYGGLGGNTAADSLDALNYYGKTKNQTHTVGLLSTYSMGNHHFTLGGQYYEDKLDDKSVKDSRYYIDNTYTNFGFFVQDDFNFFNDHLNVVVGARVDDHSEMSDPVISPRINGKYEIMEDVNLRLAYTTGFKPPQTFDEDLHIESLGGEQRVVRNASDLEPEKSQTISAGFQYEGFVGDYALLIGVTGFHSQLSDAFTEVEDSNPNSNLILWKRINSDGAEVSGIEIDLGFKPSFDSELRMGMTYKTSAYDSEQEIFDGKFTDKFLRTPDLYGYFRASYDMTEKLNFFGSAKYTGTMYVPNETTEEIVETSQTFVELDAGLTWDLPFVNSFSAKLSFGMKNITDAYQDDLQKGVDRDPAYLYGPQLPRRVYAGVDVSF